MDKFKYNDGEGIVPENAIRLSPSQLNRFFDNTSEWYRYTLLNERPFKGNTATELGKVVHAAAEHWTEHKEIPELEIIQYINSIDNLDVDKGEIEYHWRAMTDSLISEYLTKNSNTEIETEKFVWHELLPGVVVGGSIDRYDTQRYKIIDFKTMGSLDKARVPKSFPRPYYFQQMAYAWTMKQLGYRVDTLELVYVSRSNVGRTGKGGKALKDYPSEVNVLRMIPTDHDYSIIENTLRLMAESVNTWNKHPELRHLLAQDMRLKVKQPLLFKRKDIRT
jgi:hypothetical protein